MLVFFVLLVNSRSRAQVDLERIQTLRFGDRCWTTTKSTPSFAYTCMSDHPLGDNEAHIPAPP